ncbi:response regulator transcription factor [Ureibacillus aquaedulcis]|uniref:Response regulator transcription factor n=1 Tax=Ureibacillus aquaedulcis TaxID=3058421 RepID=A0ABT8GVL5_9BACL|nr:response regulator transcription factor [Ureibacillus sp. BA0131]MDN4495239.1 response regulator transcription factor [Ureibacillus sp. BA0131]
MKRKILIVEDEKQIARILTVELYYEGYETVSAYDGPTGLELALEDEWDLILLDVMLPKLDGIEVLQHFRKVNQHTPVIMLTARNTTKDKVSGLDQGANDYITKPFDIDEVFARIRAVLRVTQPKTEDNQEVLELGGIRLEKGTREAFRNGKSIELTSREFDLLAYLMENKNLVLTRDQIIKNVWGYDHFGETNVVDVYVRHLRKKLELKQTDPILHTYRGVGYSMKELGK